MIRPKCTSDHLLGTCREIYELGSVPIVLKVGQPGGSGAEFVGAHLEIRVISGRRA
jgi:hypothetical protein